MSFWGLSDDKIGKVELELAQNEGPNNREAL